MKHHYDLGFGVLINDVFGNEKMKDGSRQVAFKRQSHWNVNVKGPF
jgi:hypothetical protein